MTARDNPFLKNHFYDIHYDQLHFIKDFKRFTGLPPARFEKQVNDFGENTSAVEWLRLNIMFLLLPINQGLKHIQLAWCKKYPG